MVGFMHMQLRFQRHSGDRWHPIFLDPWGVAMGGRRRLSDGNNAYVSVECLALYRCTLLSRERWNERSSSRARLAHRRQAGRRLASMISSPGIHGKCCSQERFFGFGRKSSVSAVDCLSDITVFLGVEFSITEEGSGVAWRRWVVNEQWALFFCKRWNGNQLRSSVELSYAGISVSFLDSFWGEESEDAHAIHTQKASQILMPIDFARFVVFWTMNTWILTSIMHPNTWIG